MRRSIVVLGLAVLSACGPSNATIGGGAATPETVRISGPGGGSVRITSTADADVVEIPYPIAEAWRALPLAFDSLGLVIGAADKANYIVGTNGQKVRRQIGGVPLSRYIDCGSTQIGASADSYEILLYVRTQLRADNPNGTSVRTMVEAQGKPVNFSQAYSQCTTTGRLEKIVGGVLQAKLGH
jgi:hypothetical protein